jgi:RimJ/RimL family protein N-acetyltransferase
MKYFRKLLGERIFLSPVRIEDAEQFCEWFADAELALYLTMFDRQMTKEREEAILADMIKNNSQIFSIVTQEEEKLIGSCSLFDIDKQDRKAELGIMIGDKSFRQKGYGKEALKLLLDYGFNILNLNNIYLKVFEYNKIAINCYLRLGFKVIGNHREAHIVLGRKYDEILMDLLSEEFTESRLKNHIAEV